MPLTISRAIDNGRSVILLLLDLSAAFDTIDHKILLSRLSQIYGSCDRVLDWFSSYLSGRSQFVSVNGGSSAERDLPYGIGTGIGSRAASLSTLYCSIC